MGLRTYKVSVDDELAAALERVAEEQQRAPSEMIGYLLREWMFGICRRYPPITDAELEQFRKSKPVRVLLTAKQRNTIFERDGGKCRHCQGQLLYSDPFHIDHLIPLSKGGSNEMDNLALSCPRCNLVKHAKVVAA